MVRYECRRPKKGSEGEVPNICVAFEEPHSPPPGLPTACSVSLESSRHVHVGRACMPLGCPLTLRRWRTSGTTADDFLHAFALHAPSAVVSAAASAGRETEDLSAAESRRGGGVSPVHSPTNDGCRSIHAPKETVTFVQADQQAWRVPTGRRCVPNSRSKLSGADPRGASFERNGPATACFIPCGRRT